jgi:hypothetical protein
MLEVKKDIPRTIEYPIIGKVYDVTTNQGNIHKHIQFQGYSNGVAKPKYIFKELNGQRISINPSYEVEMAEVLTL